MIPQNSINEDLEIKNDIRTSRTFRVTSKKIQGYIDGIEALKQSIYHELNTERCEYPIFSFNYGIELENLIGKDRTYVQIELKRRIRECLLQDERITNVDNFKFEINGDEMLCTFDVTSIYGELRIRQEVNV